MDQQRAEDERFAKPLLLRGQRPPEIRLPARVAAHGPPTGALPGLAIKAG